MKYKKVSECPQPLEKWLQLINSLPSHIHLSSWRDLRSNSYFELTGESDENLIQPPPDFDYGDWQTPTFEQESNLEKAHENAVQKLKELKEFPELYDYLFKPEILTKPENIYDEARLQVKTYEREKSAYRRYEKFRQIRTDIRTIARKCMDFRKHGRFIDNEALFESFGAQTNKYKVSFRINENGKITFHSDLIDALEGADAKRLRTCPICKNVFWAKRIEAKTCPEKQCSNNFHQRKRRIKNYEERLGQDTEQLEKDQRKLEKLQSYKSPVPALIAAQEKLVGEQTVEFNKLSEKINVEKMKNGNL